MFKDVIEQLSIMGIEYFVQDLLGLLLQHCSNNGAEELNKSSLRSHLETIIRRKPNGPRSISQGISYNIVGSIAASTASSTNHNADHSPSSSVSSWEGPRAFSSRLDANINNHNSNTLQVVDSCSQPNQRNTIVQTSPQPQYQFPFSNIETGAESASSTLAPDHYNPHNNINTPSNASCSRPLRHRRRPLPQPLNTNIRFTSTPEPISSPRPDNNIFDNLRRQYQQLQLHDERQAAQQQKTDGGEQQLLHAGLVEENVNDLVNAQGKRRIKILRMPGRWIPHRRDPHKYLSHKGRQIWALKFEGIVGTFFLFTQVMSLICRIFRTNPLAILSATILAIKLVTKALYELMHSPE